MTAYVELVPLSFLRRFQTEKQKSILMPALAAFPIMSVVQPAYHSLPNDGQGNFLPSGNRLFSCIRVFATVCLDFSRDNELPEA